MKNLFRSYRTSAKYYDGAYAVKSDLVDLPSIWIWRRSPADQFWKLAAEPGGCYSRLRDKG